jgi:glycosyltransferase involved in cell wall biosynthesis
MVLANCHVIAAYGRHERGPIRIHHVTSYRAGYGALSRSIAMGGAAVWPSRAARDIPRGLDLIHYPVTVPIPATSARRVVTLHDVQHHDLPRLFSRAQRAYRRWAYNGSARTADVVVTSSHFSRGRIVETLGVDPERVEVVGFGVDRDRFHPEPQQSDAKTLRGLELPVRFALYPANLWPHKNHERLLEALALLLDRDFELVLTGQTYGRLGGLFEQARALGVDGRVRHLGYVPAAAVPALYRAADALIFPSLYEGFGAPPLEAMACGCPVAASDRTSIPEVCGDAALLFDPDFPESIAGALEDVVGDEKVRARLRTRGLERAAEFTWRVAAERHQAIYARAAAT